MADTVLKLKKPAAGDTELLSVLDLVRDRLRNGVLVVDQHGRIAGFSPATLSLLGVTSSELDHADLDVLPAPLRNTVRRCLSERITLEKEEVVLPGRSANGAVVGVSTLFATEGDQTILVVSLNDLRTVHKIERRVERVDRLASVGMLAASMGHEIKNAMVAVKTFVDLLLRQNQDAELAGLVSREMRRIDSLISQMLRFAAPAQPVLASIRLHQALAESLQLVQRQVIDHGIELHQEFKADPDLVLGDNYQLHQAFLNLLLNAIESMPSGGNLTVKTEYVPVAPGPARDKPAVVRVSIRDSGCGIAIDNLKRLFEPFFTTKPNGTGLGLVITQRIIREHSGEIVADSTPGKGTVFVVSLPAADPFPEPG
jgi:two-component system sensor histidine kinase AtoS